MDLNGLVALHILMFTMDRHICFVNDLSEILSVSLDRLMDVLKIFEDLDLIRFLDVDGMLSIMVLDRLKMAHYALNLGFDVKRISKYLDWREFEGLCFDILSSFNYIVYKNFKFKVDSKRFEIDLVGLKIPHIICVDCKHWSETRFSTIRRHLESHCNKILFLSKFSKDLFKLNFHGKLIFIPVIVTLLDDVVGIYDGVPIVSIFKFNNFLNELLIGINLIKVFEVEV
ncbi:MAG: nuclease-related domain-containing protein [Candidatus Methanomethylicia archaeon]